MTDKEQALIAALRQVENLIVAYQNPTYQNRHYFMRLETLAKARDVAREAIAKAEAAPKCDQASCNTVALTDDIFCKLHRQQEDAFLWKDDDAHLSEYRHAKEQMDNWPRPEAAND